MDIRTSFLNDAGRFRIILKAVRLGFCLRVGLPCSLLRWMGVPQIVFHASSVKAQIILASCHHAGRLGVLIDEDRPTSSSSWRHRYTWQCHQLFAHSGLAEGDVWLDAVCMGAQISGLLWHG